MKGFGEVREHLSEKSKGWGEGTLQMSRKEVTLSAKQGRRDLVCCKNRKPWARAGWFLHLCCWGHISPPLADLHHTRAGWTLDLSTRPNWKPQAREEFITILNLFTTCQEALGENKLFLITSFYRAVYKAIQLGRTFFFFIILSLKYNI